MNFGKEILVLFLILKVFLVECSYLDPPVCNGDRNATLVTCPLTCLRTCYNALDVPTECPRDCSHRACECRSGFVLDVQVLKCVLPKDCSSPPLVRCRPDEVFALCGACPITCRNLHEYPSSCIYPCGWHACVCAQGLVRDEYGRCIPPDSCLPSVPSVSHIPPGTINPCGVNEEYSQCATACPATCRNMEAGFPKCQPNCIAGCACQLGYVRNSQNQCVSPSLCEEPPKCEPLEVWGLCTGCPVTCAVLRLPPAQRPPCVTPCNKRGCICEPGLVRSDTGQCVSPEMCFQKIVPEIQYKEIRHHSIGTPPLTIIRNKIKNNEINILHNTEDTRESASLLKEHEIVPLPKYENEPIVNKHKIEVNNEHHNEFATGLEKDHIYLKDPASEKYDSNKSNEKDNVQHAGETNSSNHHERLSGPSEVVKEPRHSGINQTNDTACNTNNDQDSNISNQHDITLHERDLPNLYIEFDNAERNSGTRGGSSSNKDYIISIPNVDTDGNATIDNSWNEDNVQHADNNNSSNLFNNTEIRDDANEGFIFNNKDAFDTEENETLDSDWNEDNVQHADNNNSSNQYNNMKKRHATNEGLIFNNKDAFDTEKNETLDSEWNEDNVQHADNNNSSNQYNNTERRHDTSEGLFFNNKDAFYTEENETLDSVWNEDNVQHADNNNSSNQYNNTERRHDTNEGLLFNNKDAFVTEENKTSDSDWNEDHNVQHPDNNNLSNLYNNMERMDDTNEGLLFNNKDAFDTEENKTSDSDWDQDNVQHADNNKSSNLYDNTKIRDATNEGLLFNNKDAFDTEEIETSASDWNEDNVQHADNNNSSNQHDDTERSKDTREVLSFDDEEISPTSDDINEYDSKSETEENANFDNHDINNDPSNFDWEYVPTYIFNSDTDQELDFNINSANIYDTLEMATPQNENIELCVSSINWPEPSTDEEVNVANQGDNVEDEYHTTVKTKQAERHKKDVQVKIAPGYSGMNVDQYPENLLSCNGDPNALPGCGNYCGRTCNDYYIEDLECSNLTCRPGACDCKRGYVLDVNSNKCVLPDDCTECGYNEYLDHCPSDCQAICPQDINEESRPCPKEPECLEPACVCIFNYRRDSNDECIPIQQCPPLLCRGAHEYYEPCPATNYRDNCKGPTIAPGPPREVHECRPACLCVDSYCRNEYGYCVSKADNC